MNWILIVLAIMAGMALPMQGAINSKLASFLHNPFLSALISFAIGTIALLAYILASRIPLNQLSGVREASLVTLIGGLLGAFFITTTLVAVPKLGIALTFSLVILGQMVVTLPMDHFGLLGAAVKEINLSRIVGILMVIGGTILILRH
jgi:transporter family-2 protein